MTRLNDEQLNQFHREGYVVVEDVIDPDEVLDPLEAEYGKVLDNLACELRKEGAIASTYDGMEFGERLTRIYQESGKVHAQYFDFSLPQRNVNYDTPMWHGPAVFDVLTASPLLDAVESIVGPEIYSNPTQHVRLKPPEALTPVNPETGGVQLGRDALAPGRRGRDGRGGRIRHTDRLDSCLGRQRRGRLPAPGAAKPRRGAVPALPWGNGDLPVRTADTR